MTTDLNKKIPLHSVEAEAYILGSLISDHRLWIDIRELLNVDDFFDKLHQKIYGIMKKIKAMKKEGDSREFPFTKGSISYYLENKEDVYLDNLMNFVVTDPINVISFAKIVRERSILRQLASAGHRLAEGLENNHPDSVSELEKRVSNIEGQLLAIARLIA